MKKAEEKNLVPIIKGCIENKRRSQKLLYQEFYAYGMSICIRYVDNRDEASEILNDGFMKVFQNIKKYDLDKPFKPWLRRILVNTAINYYNKNKKNRYQEDIEDQKEYATKDNVIEDMSYQDILKMVQLLSPQYRTVFNLYVLEGYKHEEIANLLGISVGTSKSNLSKAKKVLKEILKNFFLNEKHERPIGK